MLKFADKTELNQISSTGLRALLVLCFLVSSPISLEELKTKFVAMNIMEEGSSLDILRLDLKTLKEIGCEISRADKKNENKFVLLKHPFCLDINDDDIKILKKIYQSIKKSADIKLLIEYDKFFRKITDYISDESFKNKFLGISALKHENIEMLEDLYQDCLQNRILDIEYVSPITGLKKRKQVLAQTLSFNSDKIYLYGIETYSEKETVLKVSRISKIFSRKEGYSIFKKSGFKIKYYLKNFDKEQKQKDEYIIDKDENGILVEGVYRNTFYAMQRVLSFGVNATVVEPIEFKYDVIRKLKEMRDLYG